MATQISPMLAVDDGAAAIEFYKEALGAAELGPIDADGDVVAGLSVGGVDLFLARSDAVQSGRGAHPPEPSACRRAPHAVYRS